MNLPTVKQCQQWTPMIGGAVFMLWTGFLTVLSLFPAGKEAVPGREDQAPMPTMPAPVSSPECVTMPDGLLICNDTIQGGQQ